MWLVESEEKTKKGWLGSHRWQVKCQKDTSVAGEGGFPLRSVGSKPQAGLPKLQHQRWKGTQITSSCERQQDFCLPGRDGWGHRQPLNRPSHKISFAATYPECWKREGRVDKRLLRTVWGWWLWGKNWGNSTELFPILHEPSLSGIPLWMASTPGEAIALPEKIFPFLWCLSLTVTTDWLD